MLIRRSSKKGLRKNGSCVQRQCPRITDIHTHTHTHEKKKVKMVTGEGTWTKGPFVKKTFLSFLRRFVLRESGTHIYKRWCRTKRTKTSAKGAHTKCLARLFLPNKALSIYFCNSLTAARIHVYIYLYNNM